MILREGDKVKKTTNGIIYEVRKIHHKGFVILSSGDASSTAMMSMKDLDMYFSSMPPSNKQS